MYDYLSSNGDCYYIEYEGKLVGDVSLRDNGEIAIVVCKEYQNRHIGRRCVLDMLKLAKENGQSESKYIPLINRASLCLNLWDLLKQKKSGMNI